MLVKWHDARMVLPTPQLHIDHAPALRGDRIELQPLRVDHAHEMALLLDDPALHMFIGGQPATIAELEQRYGRQAAGRSPDGTQRWLNWIIRRSDGRAALGTVQATVTVTEQRSALTAELAWVVATAHQGTGFAKEAAQVMTTWLRQQGVDTFIAHVHPDHLASEAVARSIGLAPTATVEDGEIRWEG